MFDKYILLGVITGIVLMAIYIFHNSFSESQNKQTSTATTNTQVVAYVNGEALSKEYYDKLLPEVTMYVVAPGFQGSKTELQAAAKQATLDVMILEELQYQAAVKEGIEIPENEMNKLIEGRMPNYEGNDVDQYPRHMEEIVRKQIIGTQHYENYLADNQDYIENVEVSENDIQNYSSPYSDIEQDISEILAQEGGPSQEDMDYMRLLIEIDKKHERRQELREQYIQDLKANADIELVL